MRFMLLQNYGEVESDCAPMGEWTPGDIKAHIEFQHVLNRELTDHGELVDAQGLAGPELAKFVVWDGAGAILEFRAAATRTTNLRERDYLTTQAARLVAAAGGRAGGGAAERAPN